MKVYMVLKLKFALLVYFWKSIPNLFLCVYSTSRGKTIMHIVASQRQRVATVHWNVFLSFCLPVAFFLFTQTGSTYACMRTNIEFAKAWTHSQTLTHSIWLSQLAAFSLLWKTSCLCAPVEMTALSLISLSTLQTSPNYSHCLLLRWHAHWIIDGRPAPVSLKALPIGRRRPMDRNMPTHPTPHIISENVIADIIDYKKVYPLIDEINKWPLEFIKWQLLANILTV